MNIACRQVIGFSRRLRAGSDWCSTLESGRPRVSRSGRDSRSF